MEKPDYVTYVNSNNQMCYSDKMVFLYHYEGNTLARVDIEGVDDVKQVIYYMQPGSVTGPCPKQPRLNVLYEK